MSNTFTKGNLLSFSSIAFLVKRGKIHVKDTEKPTFLILRDDCIQRTALSESPITSLKFEHLSNQRTKTTLWLVRDTNPNAAIWLVRDTYSKRSDWCKQHTILYTLTYILFKKRHLFKCSVSFVLKDVMYLISILLHKIHLCKLKKVHSCRNCKSLCALVLE